MAKVVTAANVPSPFPNKTPKFRSKTFTKARSAAPSPFRSSTMMEVGSEPAIYCCGAWNVPSPLPDSTAMWSDTEVATSSLPSRLKSPTAIARVRR